MHHNSYVISIHTGIKSITQKSWLDAKGKFRKNINYIAKNRKNKKEKYDIRLYYTIADLGERLKLNPGLLYFYVELSAHIYGIVLKERKEKSECYCWLYAFNSKPLNLLD